MSFTKNNLNSNLYKDILEYRRKNGIDETVTFMIEGKRKKELNIKAVFDIFLNQNSKNDYNGKYVLVKHNIIMGNVSLEIESNVILETDNPVDLLVEINNINDVHVLYDRKEWNQLTEYEIQDMIGLRFNKTKW